MFFSFVPTQIFLRPWAYPRADTARGSFSLGWSKWKLCPTFFVFIDPAWHPFSAVAPVWRWSRLLGGVPSANWPYFLFHPITLSFLSALSWMATWPQVFVFSSVFIAWNICSGIWIVALFFLKCQSSCTSPRLIPQWALKCSKLHITQVSCSERRMTNVPCRRVDSQPILVQFQQAQPRQNLQPWGIQPYPSCTVLTGGLHSVIN